MPAPRKWFHFSSIVEASVVPDLLIMLDGKSQAGTLQIRPVKHAGEDESGQIKSVPTGPEFLHAWIAKNPRFQIKDACHAGIEVGLTKASVYTACATMVSKGVLKRIGPGEYAAKGASKAPPWRAGKGSGAHNKRAPGDSVADNILAVIKANQNGGKPVDLATIKKGLRSRNVGATGVSPAINMLLKQQRITRPEKAHYLIAE